MLTQIIQDPFLPTARPELVLKSLETLNVTMLQAWPRIAEPVHRRSIMQSLTLCWGHLLAEKENARDQQGDSVGRLLLALTESASLFRVTLKHGKDNSVSESEISELVMADPGLTQLFGDPC